MIVNAGSLQKNQYSCLVKSFLFFNYTYDLLNNITKKNLLIKYKNFVFMNLKKRHS